MTESEKALLDQMTKNYHDTMKLLVKAEARIKELEEQKAAAVKALFPDEPEKKEPKPNIWKANQLDNPEQN